MNTIFTSMPKVHHKSTLFTSAFLANLLTFCIHDSCVHIDTLPFSLIYELIILQKWPNVNLLSGDYCNIRKSEVARNIAPAGRPVPAFR